MKVKSSTFTVVGTLMIFLCMGNSAEEASSIVVGIQPELLVTSPEPVAPRAGMSTGHGRICVTCHAPTKKKSLQGSGPTEVLWDNRESSAMFGMYVTTSGNRGTLDGDSKLCLSCHDGVNAKDNYGGSGKGMFMDNDLKNDHPIGIEYPPRNRRGVPLSGYHNPPLGNVKLYSVNGVKRVECTSCHDPHGSSHNYYLREDMYRSGLCLKCHNL